MRESYLKYYILLSYKILREWYYKHWENGTINSELWVKSWKLPTIALTISSEKMKVGGKIQAAHHFMVIGKRKGRLYNKVLQWYFLYILGSEKASHKMEYLYSNKVFQIYPLLE